MLDSCKSEKYTVELDKLTEKVLSVYLYQNVQNIEEIHKKLISKELPCCVVKASLVVDPFQITVSANKAALNEKYGQRVTNSLYTEIIYCLSTSTNISQSLKTFGISDDAPNILIVTIDDVESAEATEKKISDTIKGERVAISKLSEFSNVSLIKKTYKIDEQELKVSSLLDSIISRISEKISNRKV